MTNEEAIKIIKLIDTDGDKELNEVYALSIKALEKEEKYKWHDLRKDAEDLPKFAEGVIWVILDGKVGSTHYQMAPAEGYCLANDKMMADTKEISDIVVAWAQPMPFPEEE